MEDCLETGNRRKKKEDEENLNRTKLYKEYTDKLEREAKEAERVGS